MRKDMKKKLCEQGKYGGAGKTALRRNRRAAKQDPEGAPRPAGMKALHRGRGWTEFKSSDLNMKPIYRWLNKQEGRPWSEVYSEVCEAVPVEHRYLIDYFVEQQVKEIDGVLYDVSWGGEPRELRSWRRGGNYIDMYVDPRDGILRLMPKAPKYSRKTETNFIPHPTDPLIQYHWINGSLFEVTMRELRKNEKFDDKGYHRWYHGGYDCIDKTNERSMHEIRLRYGGDYFPVSKRQLNSREVKRVKKAA